MNDKLILSKNNVYIVILVVIILLLLVYVKFYDQLCLECIFQKKENMQNASKNENPDYESINYKEIEDENPVILGNNAMEIIKNKKFNKVYNQLEYPYKKPGFYDQSWYPNLKLPFQVIGTGYRNTPGLGGTQVAIANPPVPIDISDTNIAPRNIRIIDQQKPQLVGSVYKIFGNANQMMNLYRIPNKNNYYNYFTINQQGVYIPVITKNKTDELGDSDTVFLKGVKEPYRVTIYNLDTTPVYIPFA
jgi:hypothetical protein